MSVVIDRGSADRLVAEGAICFDTDVRQATCDGLPVRLPSGHEQPDRPVLVCGSDAVTNNAVVEHLQRSGVPAWCVMDAVHSPAGLSRV